MVIKRNEQGSPKAVITEIWRLNSQLRYHPYELSEGAYVDFWKMEGKKATVYKEAELEGPGQTVLRLSIRKRERPTKATARLAAPQ